MKKKNGEIELFRFIFALMIWLRHGAKLFVGSGQDLFYRGALSVDFFFLVSGYLMAVSCAKKYAADKGNCETGKETASFIQRKFFGLMPEMLVAWVIAYILYMIGLDEISLGIFVRETIVWIFQLIPVSMTGVTNLVFHNAFWYVSSMLLAMAVLYPLCRRYFDFFTRVIAPLTAVFILGYFQMNYSTTLEPKAVIGTFILKGILRAAAMISFGSALYPVTMKMKTMHWTNTGRKTISAVICLCMIFILSVMTFRKKPDLDIFTVYLMALVVGLAFSHQGNRASAFDRNLCYFLGKNSMLLYFCHSEVSRFIKIVYKRLLAAGRITLSLNMCSLIMWGCYIILTILTMYVVHRISEYLRRNKEKIFGFFVKQEEIQNS